MSAGKNSIFEVKNSIMKLKNRSLLHSAYFEKYELECTGIPIWGIIEQIQICVFNFNIHLGF